MSARIIRTLVLLLLVLLITVVSACERTDSLRADDTRPSAARPDEVWEATSAEIIAEILPLLAGADLVFVGEVVVVYPSFGFWTGVIRTFQDVDYKVVRVLRGDAVSPGNHIRVAHPLLGASRTVARETVALRPSLVAPGKRVLMIAVPRDPRTLDEPDKDAAHWMCAGSSRGLAPASDEIIEAVERALADLEAP